MQIQFTLGGVAVEKSEANALFKLSGVKELKVDVTDFIDKSKISPESLFELSVEEKDPGLAAVAAKYAMVYGKGKRKYEKSGRTNIIKIKKVEQDPFKTLEQLVSVPTNRSVGAAMILNSLCDGGTRTLKEIAVDQVNHLIDFGWLDKEDSPGLLKGFVWNKKTKWTANTDFKKGPLYHQCSVYTALREGLLFLNKFNLVNTEEEISFGSKNKVLLPSLKLQRRQYSVTLNDNGLQVMQTWGDSEDFIAQFWKTR